MRDYDVHDSRVLLRESQASLCCCLSTLFRCLLVCVYRGESSEVVADGTVNDDHVANR